MKNQGRSSRVTAQSVGLGWLFFLLASVMMLAQTNPVPFVNQPLVPDAVAPGGSGFTLTVNGTGFVSGAVVNWNSNALATTFVSAMQLAATVPAADTATAGSVAVTVTNPSPGGGTSAVTYFSVTNPTTGLTFTNYSQSLYFAGTVVEPAPFAVPVAGDFNGDGKLDVAFLAYATNSGTSYTLEACIELGNGDGSFQLPGCRAISPPAQGSSELPEGLVAADFNGDGKLDLALSNGYDGTNTVSIFLGNGDGTLQAPQSFPAGPATPIAVSVGDFNEDGKLDLAVENNISTSGGDISILLGNGDGTFQGPLEYVLPFSSAMLVVGDFNGDGKLDLALSNANSVSDVYVGLGNGDGTFQPPQVVANLGQSSPDSGGVAADLNGDGKLDLVIPAFVPFNTGSVVVLLGNGDGTFQSPVTYPTPYVPFGGPVVSDVNADGKQDLLVAPWSENINSNNVTLMSVLLGNGDGSFQSAVNLPTPALPVGGSGGPAGLLVGDFNGDGEVDISLPYVLCNCTSPLGSFFFFVQGSFPAANVSPSSLTFPQQAVGTRSSPQTVTLTNIGGAALSISGITLGGQDAADFAQTNNCGSGLAAGAACQINVTFTPTVIGNLSAAVVVAGDGLGGSQAVILAGSTPPGAMISLTPLSITFPSQYVGTSGLPQTVTLTNTGTASLTISSVNTSAADFGTLNACGSSVAAGAQCAIGVFFDPTTSGTRNGTLTVSGNASNSPQSVALSGSGQDFSMAPSGSPTATISPGQTADYTLAVAPAGGFSQTVSLTCDGAPAGATCSVPSSVTLNGSGSTPVKVTVTTATTSGSLIRPGILWPGGIRLAIWLGLFGLPGLVILGAANAGRRNRRDRVIYALAFACLFSLAITSSACGGGNGGGGNSGGGGVAPGNYTLTVTGTFTSGSSNLKHAANLTLVVQ